MELIFKRFNDLSTKELYEILKARAEIFIMEQQINYQDMDNIDYDAIHCFFMDNDKVTAYLRAFHPNNKKDELQIGRVLTLEHGKGLGKKLMEESLELLKEIPNIQRITMHAQKHAIGFYRQFGFETVGDEFVEEEVVHITMTLDL